MGKSKITLLILLGFIIGSSSILFVYGDLNTKGITGLYQTYKAIKQKQKEADEKLVQEYMQEAQSNTDKPIEKSTLKSKTKTNDTNNKWIGKIKRIKPIHSLNLEDYTDLKGNKAKYNLNKTTFIIPLPYDKSYGVHDNKSPQEYARIQKNNLENMLKAKEYIGEKVDFILSVSDKMYIEDFNSNPAKLIKYIKEKYPKINFPILIEKSFQGSTSILRGTLIELEYLYDEKFSDKYMEQLIYIINNDNYNNKNLFPPKEYIMSKKMSPEAIKYFESITGKKMTDKDLYKNDNIKPKIIGYGHKTW